VRAPSKTGDPRLGEAIRKARGTMRLSQEELARKVGVTQAAIGQWEAGATYPSRNHLPALVKVLNLNVPSLMLGTPIKDHRAHEPSGPECWKKNLRSKRDP
jgi:transcriptional regulator with XRE-family HTH domain